MEPLKPNTRVLVKSLKQQGVVLERVKTGYLVACGSVKITCALEDLDVLPADKWKKYAKHVKKSQGVATPSDVALEIDLHGMRVEEALSAVTSFLDRALVADVARVEIVHGVGTGRLLHAIHGYLKTVPTVKRFELDMNNPGMTKVYF